MCWSAALGCPLDPMPAESAFTAAGLQQEEGGHYGPPEALASPLSEPADGMPLRPESARAVETRHEEDTTIGLMEAEDQGWAGLFGSSQGGYGD